MAAKKKEDLIEVLMEHEPVPENTVTFGKLISQALKEKEAETEITAKETQYQKKYERWLSQNKRSLRYRADDPIFSARIYWELRICRFPDEAIQWFSQLPPLTRIDLCILTRKCQRRAI